MTVLFRGSRSLRDAGYRIGQVGSFVRVPLGYIDLFGVVAKVGAGRSRRPCEK